MWEMQIISGEVSSHFIYIEILIKHESKINKIIAKKKQHDELSLKTHFFIKQIW